MARIRLLIDNFVDAMLEGSKSGEFDIAQVSPENFEEYYIMFKPLAGNYRDQWQILHMKTTYGAGTNYVFPKQAPLIKFATKVLHTNISTGGSICLDILKDNTKWMPTYSFSMIILNIMLLYMEPNGMSPFNTDASRKYDACKRMFNSRKIRGMAFDEEEKLLIECFQPFKAAADAYASSDLTQFAKWFPQIVGKERTTEDQDQRTALIASVLDRRAKLAEKKKALAESRKAKMAKSKKNRWAKHQK